MQFGPFVLHGVPRRSLSSDAVALQSITLSQHVLLLQYALRFWEAFESEAGCQGTRLEQEETKHARVQTTLLLQEHHVYAVFPLCFELVLPLVA